MGTNKRPVIVFDSGFGGISVLKQLVDLMPNESFIYYGDSANAPYGPRDPEEVCRLTVGAISKLREFDAKAVVIACNTATAASEETLIKLYPDIPIIGIEPAVRLAAKENTGESILCLATAGTLASARYKNQLREVGDTANVVSVPAPGIVTYVESGMRDREGIVNYLRELLSPWKGTRFSGVVLGCTHFPFAAEEVRDALGYPVRFYEPGKTVAETAHSRLISAGTAGDENDSGSITMMNSTNKKDMIGFSWKLFSSPLKTGI